MRPLIALFLLAGCYRPGTTPEPRVVADLNARPTVRAEQFTSREQWMATGYYRQGQDEVIDVPVQVAIANDGSACIVDNVVWAGWREHTVVSCRTAWRVWRVVR